MFKPVQFGKYYLTERIAVGGMAEIFKAKLCGVSGFEKLMVVKQILPQYARNAEFIKMFIDEAKIAVSLEHGNIVGVYELGRIDGVYFIAMEYVPGHNLGDVVEAGRTQQLPLSVDHAVFIAIEICKGLDYAHRRTDADGTPLGVVHRDISPTNIMVSVDGMVKITDFGIAKARSKLGNTDSGVVKGTYGYMSPEQISGTAVDYHTDIFSTGILLYEMLTGSRLFESSNNLGAVKRVQQAELTPPSLVNHRVPPEVDLIVLKALAREPAERYPDAGAFQLALSRFLFSSGRGATSASLAELAAWLQGCGVDSVALEATGVYWIPVFEVLEGRGLQVSVVNARHFKNVPGRKSDRQDCQWLQELHSVGLLRGSFRPPAEVAALRAYLRQRATLIEHRAAHIQHMQKALVLMNVQLTQVVKDVTGVTGLAIIRAIVAGAREPQQLAALRQPGVKQSEAHIIRALSGHYQAEHVFALKQALALYDVYTAQMRECDAEIARQFSNLKPSVPPEDLPPLPPNPKPDSRSKNGPTYEARSLLYQWTGVDLVAITGLNASTVQSILAETGVELTAWPTAKHFCSWLGLAPHNDISGGKRLRSRTLKTHNRAGQAFRLAAQSVSRSPNSAFGTFYRRMRARLGAKQAIVATAHKIARTFYHVLKYRTAFHDLGGAEYERLAQERERRNLEKRATKLGLRLVPAPVAQS